MHWTDQDYVEPVFNETELNQNQQMPDTDMEAMVYRAKRVQSK